MAINVIDTIAGQGSSGPGTSTYPIVHAADLQGGVRPVAALSDVVASKRASGMLAMQIDSDSAIVPFRLESDGTTWSVASLAGYVLFSAVGDGSDDWPRLKALMDKWAGKARILCLPGEYRCRSWQIIPSYTKITFLRGAHIDCLVTQPNGDAVPKAPLCHFSTLATQTLTMLLTAATVGSRVIRVQYVAAPGPTISIGSVIQVTAINQGLRSQYYTVVAMEDMNATVGGWNLTLDRAVNEPWPYASRVAVISERGTDIEIEGGYWTGSVPRLIEISGGYNCHIRNLRAKIDAGDLGVGCSFDIGSHLCSYEKVYMETTSSGTGSWGLAFESAVDCVAQSCVVAGPWAHAFIPMDCWNAQYVNCSTAGAPLNGVYSTCQSNDAGKIGNKDLLIDRCTFSGCTRGIWEDYGYNTTIRKTTITGASVAAVKFDAGSNNPSIESDCRFTNNAIGVISASTGLLRVNDSWLRDNTTCDLQVATSARARNSHFLNSGTRAVDGTGLTAGQAFHASDCEFTTGNSNSGHTGIIALAGGTGSYHKLDNCDITISRSGGGQDCVVLSNASALFYHTATRFLVTGASTGTIAIYGTAVVNVFQGDSTVNQCATFTSGVTNNAAHA